MMGFGYGGMGFGGFGILGMVVQIVVLIGIIWLVVYLVKHFSQGQASDTRTHNAQEIVAQRFARGEISEEEYKKMRDML